MSRTKKAFLIALPLLLIAAIVATLSYDSLAAYYQSTRATSSPIYAKNINFTVNGSGAQTVPLGNMTVTPKGNGTWTVTLDARGSEVPLNASFALNLSYSGTWATGLSVFVNNTKISPGTTYALNYANIQNTSPQTVTIRFYWDTSPEAGYCRTGVLDYIIDRYLYGKPIPGDFEGFRVTAAATVTAAQTPS